MIQRLLPFLPYCGFGAFAVACLRVLYATLRNARNDLFWFDELFTLYIASAPNAASIWKSLLSGADQQPFLFYWITSWTLQLDPGGGIGLRLPALLGITLGAVCVYFCCRPHLPRIYSLLAAAMLLASGAGSYTSEARPYGLVVGTTALALLSWQRLGHSGRRRVWALLLFLSLSAGIGCHYYAGMVVIALGAAELARSLENRRIDLLAWAAMAAAASTVLLYWPLISAARAICSVFWAKPALLTGVLSTYSLLLNLLVFVLAPAFCLLLFSLIRVRMPDDFGRLRLSDLAGAASLSLIPFLGVLIGRFVTGAYHPRYMIFSVVGISTGAAYMMWALTGGRRWLGPVLLLGLSGVLIASPAPRVRASIEPHLNAILALVESAPDPSGQFLVTSPLHFLEAQHYAPPQTRARLGYLAESGHALVRAGTDAPERSLQQLATIRPVAVRRYSLSEAPGRRWFVIHRDGIRFAWLLPQLIEDGAELRLLRTRGPWCLYEVRLPARQPLARTTP